MFNKNKNHLYLDCDGVAADFDKHFIKLVGMKPKEFEHKYGTKEFWRRINQEQTFFADLEMMDGFHDIYNAVKHLKPTFLTGAPSNKNYYDQKRDWIERFFGKEQKIIICESSKKSQYCNSGDVIIDDMEKHMQKWIDKGGIWILHKSTEQTIKELYEIGVLP